MNREVFQLSIYGATFVGLLDGVLDLAQIKKYGDFGIGAIESLEGELTLSNGIFYHANSDGDIQTPEPHFKTPKMTVTKYIADRKFTIDEEITYPTFKKILMGKLPSLNYIYAIRVKATYKWVKLMSYPKQVKPYPTIDVISGNKIINTINNIEGNMIGFYTPLPLVDLCGPSLHFHLFDSEHKLGGHIVDFCFSGITVEYQYKNTLNIQLPDNDDFHKSNLDGVKEQLDKIISSLANS
ncbi:TPA: acetolactate decarboxylase [Yersinia enterocolitica]|uniref:acetolactate decarboxylase n=1 Tax=Yersinia TaxID=629 RepID=UPI00065DA2A3|nr:MULTISPECIES: acetolactate decarboxylase [Yersinia]CRY75994.1 alpha-acetolactate decarboxylase [Yersinia intermedia]